MVIIRESIRARGPRACGEPLIERPRARRYPFAASADLVDMASETEIREQTTDLSVFGCQVTAQKVWAVEQKDQLVLEKWLAEARDIHERTSNAH